MQPIKDTDLYTDGQHTYRQKNQGDYVVYILVKETAPTKVVRTKKTVSLDEPVVLKSV